MENSEEKRYILSVRKKIGKNSKLFSNTERVKYMMAKNNGYITTKEIDDKKLGRDYLKKLVNANIIKCVARGIYYDSSRKENSYYTFQMRYPKTIFSHITALSIWGFIDLNKKVFDITCINNVFANEFKIHNVFYVKKSWINIGLTEIEYDRFTIKLYDIERCICDIVRSKNRLDSKLVDECISKYLQSKNKNVDNLINYAKQMDIYNIIFNYLEQYKNSKVL